jgi:hypothetical protein
MAADKAHHDPRAAALGRDVEGHPDRPVLAHHLAGQPVLAPERGRVDGLELHQRALRHVLGELIAERRERRLVDDARREHGRDRHDHAPAVHHEAIRVNADPGGCLLDSPRRRIQ